MKMKIILLCFYLALFINVSGQRFESNLVGGLQLSDLDGEMGTMGYNFGIKGLYNLSDKWSIGTGILATQNGDYLSEFPKGLDFETLRLSFIEIPVQVGFAYGKDKKRDFYRIRFYGGASYARLYNQTLISPTYGDMSDNIYLPKSAIVPNFGVVGFITPRIGIDFKSSLALHGEFSLAFRGIFVI